MIKWLKDLTKDDMPFVGGKAANLAALIRGGFAVPEGIVYYGDMPYDELHDFTNDLGIWNGNKFAVRSSAVGEDGTDFSYAGQFNTYLNVEGYDNIRQAIDDCIESLENVRAKSYGKGLTEMAVIIQRMVNADVAGVMFTKEPVTNAPWMICIEAVSGLGDKLVDGSVTPESYTINKYPYEVLESPDSTTRLITPDNLYKLAFTGVMIEEYFGSPQDIEWAIEDDTIYVCQARPITT